MKFFLTVTVLLALFLSVRSETYSECKEDSECTDTYGDTACCAYVSDGTDDGHICYDREVLEAAEKLAEENDVDVEGEFYCDNAITLLVKSAIVSVGAFFALY